MRFAFGNTIKDFQSDIIFNMFHICITVKDKRYRVCVYVSLFSAFIHIIIETQADIKSLPSFPPVTQASNLQH